MNIDIREGFDAKFTEEVTRNNMMAYYKRRNIDWCKDSFLMICEEYKNFQVLSGAKQVATFSLSFSQNLCLIRDLQVSKECQNKGVGKFCLNYIYDYACANNYSGLGLKVFSENTAIKLYERFGFVAESDSGGAIKMLMSCEASV
ncbi:MAG: GNAT superfamily N-acetyltransferase [Motiliproteus sp.]|jgi:GNAT superfamily N-acetyltransferase